MSAVATPPLDESTRASSTEPASAPTSIGGASEDDERGLFTSYAVTRWYRPPELLCGNRRYGPAIDLWSAGCVLGELIGRAPLFARRDHMEMLRAINAQLGSPGEGALRSIEDDRAVRFLRRMPPLPPRAWADSLPGGAPGGLDLLDQLLRWDPADRLSASSALRHPWILPLATPADLEPLPPCPFDFEGLPPNLDYFYLAALDAAAETNADAGYTFRLPELLRFGILHDRTVYPVGADAPPAGAAEEEEERPLFTLDASPPAPRKKA